MSTRNADSVTIPAGADLSAKQGAFLKMSGATVIACSVLGERSDFVLNNAPTSGQAAECMPDRGKLVPIKVGAVAVAAGDELTPDANGLAKTAVSTNIVHAKALEAGGAGTTIRAIWVDAYAKP